MIVKGYVNIQKSSSGFYLGADIHPDLDSAKAAASKATVTQIYIAFDTEDKPERKQKDMSEYYVQKVMEEERLQERIRAESKRKLRKPKG